MTIRRVRLMFVAVVAVMMLMGFAPAAFAQAAPQQQSSGPFASLAKLNIGDALAQLGLLG